MPPPFSFMKGKASDLLVVHVMPKKSDTRHAGICWQMTSICLSLMAADTSGRPPGSRRPGSAAAREQLVPALPGCQMGGILITLADR
jgi:hypothetical protein